VVRYGWQCASLRHAATVCCSVLRLQHTVALQHVAVFGAGKICLAVLFSPSLCNRVLQRVETATRCCTATHCCSVCFWQDMFGSALLSNPPSQHAAAVCCSVLTGREGQMRWQDIFGSTYSLLHLK